MSKKIHWKRGFDDYFVSIGVNPDGFSILPYKEYMQGSPYSQYQTFRVDSYCWLWFTLYVSRGFFNMERYRASERAARKRNE